VNAAGGSLTIEGLPASWIANQTYPLTITIQRTGARLFGFQLSAVGDATIQQAGSFSPGNARVKIICGATGQPNNEVPCQPGLIQYAEHSNANVVTNTYLVNWTAPSSVSFGPVRFNLAGNAANGDFSNLGDFVYTRVDVVPAGAAIDLSVRAFTLVDRGGVSMITDGGGDLNVGYSRIQPNTGNTTPAGVAIFGFRQSGVIVTEAGVPASEKLTSARIYGEVNGPVNTGVAISNPNDQTATISFQYTDSSGVDFGGGSFTLEPNQQTAKFLNEDPFLVLESRNPFQGTVTFTSNVPISLIALRGYSNERVPSEFLITTLPVTNLSAAAASGDMVKAKSTAGIPDANAPTTGRTSHTAAHTARGIAAGTWRTDKTARA